VAEALNDPPYIILEEDKTKLDLIMPIPKRRLMYVISGLKLLVWCTPFMPHIYYCSKLTACSCDGIGM